VDDPPNTWEKNCRSRTPPLYSPSLDLVTAPTTAAAATAATSAAAAIVSQATPSECDYATRDARVDPAQLLASSLVDQHLLPAPTPHSPTPPLLPLLLSDRHLWLVSHRTVIWVGAVRAVCCADVAGVSSRVKTAKDCRLLASPFPAICRRHLCLPFAALLFPSFLPSFLLPSIAVVVLVCVVIVTLTHSRLHSRLHSCLA